MAVVDRKALRLDASGVFGVNFPVDVALVCRSCIRS